ncbi:MAG: FAD-dependent monooxygenase [Pseudomonadota bacterium]
MNIAIVGAGIGGLTTALFLESAGHTVEIYEKAGEIKPVGAGIILAHNAMQVYDKLGLKNEISYLGHPLTSINTVTPTFRLITKVSTAYFDKQCAVQSIAIHRGVLQGVLIDHLSSATLHLNKELVDITDGDSVSLTFSDGSEAHADLVIAADGIRSVIRNALFAKSVIRHARQIVFRGIVKFQLPKKYTHQLNEAWGAGSRFGFVQISQDQIYWYALKNMNPAHEERSLKDIFSGYAPVVTDIISRMNVNKILQHDMEDLQPIRSWVRKRVCLLGDAAHATTPNMGQGACQAIEDAYALSECLKHETLESALQEYERLRKPKANYITNMSWMIGKVAQLNNPLLSRLRNFIMRLTPERLSQRQLAKVVKLSE